MRALVLDHGLHYRPDRRERRLPRGEARVEVLLAGICNTDLELARGYMGFAGVPGHEFVGRVVEGPAKLVGRRVVGEINAGCGRCAGCRRGDSRHCPKRTVLGILGRDGAFADRLTLPIANLRRVPDSLPDEAAVFVEPVAAAFEILEQMPTDAGREAVVLGDGKLGLLVAQVLAQAGYAVTSIGKHEEKLRTLRKSGVRVRLVERVGALRADVVAECTGTAGGLQAALAIVRPRGTVFLKSTVAGQASLDLAPAVINEVRIQGSRCGRFEPAIAALAAKRVDVSALVSAECPLERGVEAFQRAAAPGVLKVLLRVAR